MTISANGDGNYRFLDYLGEGSKFFGDGKKLFNFAKCCSSK